MQDANLSRFASMLAALSQPTRLRIVDVVASGGPEGTPAGEIARAVHCPASTLSFHLKELTQAGLLNPQPQGRFIRYSIVSPAFGSLSDYVRNLPRAPKSLQPETPAGTRPRKRRKAARPAAGKGEGQLSIFDE